MALPRNDWLSRMPDDILVGILSSLPLKEAARTSVLSSRWTNLWRYSVCLNFEADDKWHKFGERDKYVNWVKSVLRLHKAPTIDEFRICFDLDKSNCEAITRWLEFAFARRVQRLELNLLKCGVALIRNSAMYVLPAYLRHFDVKSLKALCFRGVNVGGEYIDFFLHNCPFLEELIVQGLREMSKVEVCGSSLALKHLEIFDKLPVKISAPKLTSLKVATLSGLLLQNVPMLVEFTLIRGDRNPFKHQLVRSLHCYIFQLETLTLSLNNTTEKESEFCEFPQMSKLNKLVINIAVWYDQSVVALNCLMRASPHLHELELKSNVHNIIRARQNDVMHSPHLHLKVLKFSGYNCGHPSDAKLVRYILVNCAAIKKIIIYPQDAGRTRSHVKQQLEADVPHHIQLLIL